MSSDFETILSLIIKAGYQLSPDAFNFLKTLPNDEAKTLVHDALTRANHSKNEIWIFDKNFLIEVEKQNNKEESLFQGIDPISKRIEPQINIIYEDTKQKVSDVNGFVKYFNSRFEQLERILKRRVDVKDAITLKNVLQLPLKSKFKTIGMVTSKRTRGERLFLELETPDCTITVMASGQTVQKGLEILDDQVICIEGIKYRDDLLIANEFIWPDIPMHETRRAEEPICTVFIADVHIGSKHFRGDLFNKLIRWLNLELGNMAAKELASRVKYLVIAGDLVEGIGIFVDQLDELTITSQIEQYEEAARLLSQIPDYIEIIILPGNHDAVRRSLPQPVIPESYAPSLYKNTHIHMASNPCLINLHGVNILISHGKALDDILSNTPGYDFHYPIQAVELLVRCRHFAPRYGQTTPIAPEATDRLVIKNVPDVVLMGHIHIQGYKKYKGITLVSAGAFQDQTPYQKRMNLMPTPGEVSVFDLQTHQLIPLDLKRMD